MSLERSVLTPVPLFTSYLTGKKSVPTGYHPEFVISLTASVFDLI